MPGRGERITPPPSTPACSTAHGVGWDPVMTVMTVVAL